MNRIMLRTLTLLTAVLCAQAMEQQSADQKTELSATIIACDATTFATSWKTFQESTPADELAAIRIQLTQLATQLKNHKEHVRTLKLKNMKGRMLAGICAVPMAVLSGVFGLIYADIVLGQEHLPCIYELSQNNYSEALKEAAGLIMLCILITYPGRYALRDINYARCANTQELSAQIASLDTILACLTPAATTQEILG